MGERFEEAALELSANPGAEAQFKSSRPGLATLSLSAIIESNP